MTLEQYLITLAVIALSTAAGIVFVIARHFLRAVRKRNAAAIEEIELKPIDLDGIRLFRSIVRNSCPDCKWFGFYAGPRGGASQHIYCTNADCRAAFNVTFFTGTDGKVERIESKSREWYHVE